MDKEQAYTVLSELIFKGFLVAELSIDGKSLIFKTINNKELENIRILAGSQKSLTYTPRFNAYYLAFSVISAEGVNFLNNREKNINDMYKYFLEIPMVLFKRILEKTSGLRNDALLASKYLEGFCYTSKSRNFWKINKGLPVNRHFLTGFKGTSELGLNVFQENWTFLNRSLDAEEEYNNQFNMALLIASATNPKGSRKIRNQHQGQMKNVEARRKRLAKEGFIDERKWHADGWAAPVDTTEELVAELERQMKGIKDKHDIFMENYMQKLKEQTDKRAKEAEARIKRAREGMEDIYLTSTQRELTSEETKEMIKNRKQRSTVNTASDSQTSESDKQRFLNKVSGRVLTGSVTHRK